MVKVDLSGAAQFFSEGGPDYSAALKACNTLVTGSGAGNDFLGWLTLAHKIKETELSRIEAAAEKIRSRSSVLVVIGIGGSYLGARGAIDFLRPVKKEGDVEILFAGNGLSPDYLNDIIYKLGDRDFDVNVISKSGTTLEPAVSFRIFRALLEKKYGDKANDHIFATTDAARGALKQQADSFGWESFVVPDDVGGRYSVLSAVGLLPIAVAGINIRTLIDSAIEEMEAYCEETAENPALIYAAARQHLYSLGYKTEILACYEPSFRFMAEWWKQLYGESEGKEGKGIYPASCDFTTDLHSMGQWIQEGERTIFETCISVETPEHKLLFPSDAENLDGLNFLAGKRIDEVNKNAELGTRLAHVDGGVPNILVSIERLDAYNYGQLIYFFEKACGISGQLLGVNAFNQPGVEAYKKNMFALLEKPGYEAETKAIRAKLAAE